MNMLSYLFPITLFKGKTAMKTKLEVRELFGQRKLDLDGFPQSGTNYLKYWRRVFDCVKISDLPDKGEFLVLGLGGGDLAKLISKVLPRWHATFVELEPEIEDIAKKYFGVESNSQRLIIIEDAKNFMLRNTKKYNIVIVDLYNGDSIPEFVTTQIFLEQINAALNSDGFAIFNYASHSFREDDLKSFKAKLKKIFKKVSLLKYKGHPFYLTSR